jgi:hypothetical protein
MNEIVIELREMARDGAQPDCDLDTLSRAALEIERLERDADAQLGAISILRAKLALVLSLAKGYAVANPVGSNGAYISAAERALDDTENFNS